MIGRRRGLGYWLLAGFFGLFVLFLYGPTLTILVLSFQGPSGGLTFPMNGVSLHWFKNLFEKQMVGDFAGSLQRSMFLGVAVMLVTVAASFSAGLAFRSRFKGSTFIFYLAIASLIVPYPNRSEHIKAAAFASDEGKVFNKWSRGWARFLARLRG